MRGLIGIPGGQVPRSLWAESGAPPVEVLGAFGIAVTLLPAVEEIAGVQFLARIARFGDVLALFQDG
jgi:hypothetical protein